MSERPTLAESMMQTAFVWSKRSVCNRLQVGCVISNEEMTNVDAIGYNGPAKGLPHEPESTEPGKTGFIHAEVNAIVKANYAIKNKKMFVTHSPCRECAKLIINAGISEVFYANEYRDNSSLELLKGAGIKVTKLTL